MRIGDVARQAGVSTRALRYYEEQGLLESERTSSGQRTYPESAVERVRLIQQFFTAGLPSRTILQLLPCVDAGHGTPETFELLAAERDRISAAIADLTTARDALDRIIDIAHHPTPEHCPALRETPWEPYVAEAPSAAPVSEERVFFRDIKPYEVPASLNDLRGPAAGSIELPHAVYWGPDRRVDLDTVDGSVKAYQAVIREGTAEDQSQILNRDRLLGLWASLTLPDRVRLVWEERFPELRELAVV